MMKPNPTRLLTRYCCLLVMLSGLSTISIVFAPAAPSAPAAPAPAAVTESARQIPVLATVDVVVVGGTSGAVAAASSAAKAGARVFLLAPRPYLGEDLAGTMRLWLEPGETPGDSELARKLFAKAGQVTNSGGIDSLEFTYKADLPADPRHPDTVTKPTRLSDGAIGQANSGSVQFDGDVTLTAAMAKPQCVKEARIVLFHRARDYSAQSVTIETSDNGKKWKPGATVKCVPEGELITASTPIGAATRFVRFHVKRAPGAKRLLIAEIALLPERAAPAATPEPDQPGPIRPLVIKQTLDEELLAAKVQFLYGCYPSDVLRDAQGNLCGVVMVNRSGRQAIVAKAVIDATEHGVVARLAGAGFTPFQPGPVTLKWVTIAEKARSGEGVAARKLNYPLAIFDKLGRRRIDSPAAWYEYTMSLNLPDESWAARAELAQKVRDLAFDPSQLYSSDSPFLVPPTAVKGAKSASAGASVDNLDLDVFRPAGVERLWVLSGCADVPRATAEKLLRPVAYIQAGTRVGQAVAAEIKSRPAPQDVKVTRAPLAASAAPQSGEVKEPLTGLRPWPPLPRVSQAEAPLPVLGSYDVVVVGGGTAGAPAAIAAARAGSRTLLLEYLDGLGGVGTLGMIGGYCIGNRVGFTATVPELPIEVRMDWYRHELRQAGADVWFETIGCGALASGNRVTGVVVATPWGRGVVLAKDVVDATGNSDIAIAAGAKHQFVEDYFAVQNAHIPPREVGASYMNGDRDSISDADLIDTRNAFLNKGTRYSSAFDWGQVIDSRERRRIVGDFTLDWTDIVNQRTYPDTITRSRSNYDSHGYQIHPYFMLRPANWQTDQSRLFMPDTPYRCLLPQGVEGILVAGLGMSAHRDAMPIVRMQPDLHNQGYAAGYAAALAAKGGITPRQIDVKALQKHLVSVGNLDAKVLSDRDSYPLPAEKISAAIQSVKQNFTDLAVLLAQPKDSLPALRQAYATAEGADKVTYAKILGIMGDATGLETLLKEGERLLKEGDKEDAPVAVKGQSRFAPDELTQVVYALGNARDRRAVPLLCTISGELDGQNVNRYRAVVVSLGRIGDPAAAPTLSRMANDLMQPRDKEAKRADVRQLLTAVALYRCGDKNGQARQMLEQIAAGPNGPWAELALQVLGK